MLEGKEEVGCSLILHLCSLGRLLTLVIKVLIFCGKKTVVYACFWVPVQLGALLCPVKESRFRSVLLGLHEGNENYSKNGETCCISYTIGTIKDEEKLLVFSLFKSGCRAPAGMGMTALLGRCLPRP